MSASAKTNEWKVGLFVVLILGAAFVSVLWLGKDKLERKLIPAVTYLDESVQGLDVGAPVKFRGVTVGRVSQIGVAPDRRHVAILVNFYQEVLSSLGLRKADAKLDMTQPFAPPEARFQLASAGITGVRFLALDVLDPDRYPTPELPFPVPWNYVPAAPSTLKSLEDTFNKVAADIPTLLLETKRLLVEGRRFLQDVDARGLSKEAQTLMKHADQAILAVDARGLNDRARSALDDTRRTLATFEKLAQDVDGMVAELRDDDGELRTLLREATAMSARIRKALDDADIEATGQSVRRTADAVTDLAADARPVADGLQATLVELREATAAVRRLAEALERDPGALLHGRQPAAQPPGGSR